MSASTLSRSLRFASLLLVLAAVGVGAYYYGYSRGHAAGLGPAANAIVTGPLGEQSRRLANDPLAIGAVDAPVVMVVFSDFRCPFCARFSTVTEPELVERFVDQGLLRIEWRDLPIFGDDSILAARAGRAAAAQGKFWEFMNAVYAAAPAQSHHMLDAGLLAGFAEQVGVKDIQRFRADMASDRFDEGIIADAAQAQLLGLTGTPSFVLGGHGIVGAQPTELFVQVVEQLLAEAPGR